MKTVTVITLLDGEERKLLKWDENEHPRDGGKFTSKGGGNAKSSIKQTDLDAPDKEIGRPHPALPYQERSARVNSHGEKYPSTPKEAKEQDARAYSEKHKENEAKHAGDAPINTKNVMETAKEGDRLFDDDSGYTITSIYPHGLAARKDGETKSSNYMTDELEIFNRHEKQGGEGEGKPKSGDEHRAEALKEEGLRGDMKRWDAQTPKERKSMAIDFAKKHTLKQLRAFQSQAEGLVRDRPESEYKAHQNRLDTFTAAIDYQQFEMKKPKAKKIEKPFGVWDMPEEQE